jgi:hypothetical protein
VNLAALTRLLTPSKNAPGLSAALALTYALVQAIAYHKPFGSPLVYLPLIAAALAAYTRTQVTPVADPRDGNGNPLHGPLVDAPKLPAVTPEAHAELPGYTLKYVADQPATPPPPQPEGTTP